MELWNSEGASRGMHIMFRRKTNHNFYQDVIVEDVRVELGVMLDEWRSTVAGPVKKSMFLGDIET